MTRYAIGCWDEEGVSYGIVLGPVRDLRECFDFVPDDDVRPCHILQMVRISERMRYLIVAEWNYEMSIWKPVAK